MFGFSGPIAAGGLSYSPSNPQASVTSPLVNTASSYPYPATSGLLGALSAPAGTPDYSQMALQMAQGGGSNPGGGLYPSVGAPNSSTGGLYPSVAVPPVTPGSIPSSGGGSNAAATVGGLLAAMAKNPGLVKGAVNAGKGIAGLFGGGAPAALPALTASDIAAGAVPGGLSDAAAAASTQGFADAGIAALPDASAYGAAAAPAAAAPAASAPAAGGLMGALGPAAAVAAPLAIAALGAEQSPVTLSGGYMAGLQKGLQAPKGSATYNNAAFEIAGLLANGGAHNSNAGLQALASQNGLQPYIDALNDVSAPRGNLGNSSIYGTIRKA